MVPTNAPDLRSSSYGNGDSCVVLLHSLALDRRMWPPALTDDLATGHRVLAFDLPGHGESPLDETRTIEEMATRVIEAMARLDVGRAALVGLSMGGCVAQAVAIQRPELVRSLGLVDTTSWYGPDARERWAERAETARKQGMRSLAEFQASRWFTDEYRRTHPEEVERLLSIFAGMDVDCYEVACGAMGAVNLQPNLGRIDCPTSVIVGESDYATPYEHAEVLAQSIRGASLHVVERASHLSAVERPDAVLRALSAVL